MSDLDQKLHDSMDRLGASALEWRKKAEGFETALMLIASYAGKTLIRMPQDASYSEGAANAFDQLSSLASAALAMCPPHPEATEEM